MNCQRVVLEQDAALNNSWFWRILELSDRVQCLQNCLQAMKIREFISLSRDLSREQLVDLVSQLQPAVTKQFIKELLANQDQLPCTQLTNMFQLLIDQRDIPSKQLVILVRFLAESIKQQVGSTSMATLGPKEMSNMVKLLEDTFGMDFTIDDIKGISCDLFPLITAFILVIAKKDITCQKGLQKPIEPNLFKDITNKILLGQKICNSISSALVQVRISYIIFECLIVLGIRWSVKNLVQKTIGSFVNHLQVKALQISSDSDLRVLFQIRLTFTILSQQYPEIPKLKQGILFVTNQLASRSTPLQSQIENIHTSANNSGTWQLLKRVLANPSLQYCDFGTYMMVDQTGHFQRYTSTEIKELAEFFSGRHVMEHGLLVLIMMDQTSYYNLAFAKKYLADEMPFFSEQDQLVRFNKLATTVLTHQPCPSMVRCLIEVALKLITEVMDRREDLDIVVHKVVCLINLTNTMRKSLDSSVYLCRECIEPGIQQICRGCQKLCCKVGQFQTVNSGFIQGLDEVDQRIVSIKARAKQNCVSSLQLALTLWA